jgi:hypothetical protein
MDTKPMMASNRIANSFHPRRLAINIQPLVQPQTVHSAAQGLYIPGVSEAIVTLDVTSLLIGAFPDLKGHARNSANDMPRKLSSKRL